MDKFKLQLERRLIANFLIDKCKLDENAIIDEAWCTQDRIASQKQLIVVFGAVKPPKATSWQSRASAGDRQRLCDGREKLE